MKSIDTEEFFKKVSANSGVSDLRTIKDIYYGMVRTMSRELRERQTIKLPDWGDFNIKVNNSRRIVNVNTGKLTTIPAKPIVKFAADYKVKKYFQSLSDQRTVL